MEEPVETQPTRAQPWQTPAKMLWLIPFYHHRRRAPARMRRTKYPITELPPLHAKLDQVFTTKHHINPS